MSQPHFSNPIRWAARLFAGLSIPWIVCAAEHEIPPAFGPHLHPQTADFATFKSFKSNDRIVGAYYFYWYCTETKEHIVNPEDGSDGLTDHPPTLDDFCYRSVAWHKKQLADMADAGIDLALLVFWGAPSEREATASLYWSYAGLAPLVEAREQLLREAKHPPLIGLFYDTSTLQFNRWKMHVDLTTDYGRNWFYATIRDFFSAIPPRHWAMLDEKPICLLYAAAFARKHDQSFVEFTKTKFKADFNRDLYLAPQDSWKVKADNVCAWGGALGLKNPGIGELGPGYDDTAVYGRKPLIAKRNNGRFYENNWTRFLRRPSNFVMIETWSEFHEGTEICESREYGRQYINLTRKFSEFFKKGVTPSWPKGTFTNLKSISLLASQSNSDSGLRLITAEDGKVSAQKFQNSFAWVPARRPGQPAYIYFAVDDSFKWANEMTATVEVQYFDTAPGFLGLEYDGEDINAPFRGAYSSASRIELRGSKRWQSASFTLDRARFLNSQNAGADLRLVLEAPEIAIRKITLNRQ